MTKLLIIAAITFFAKVTQAQVYDTYGRSQSTREWQEYERHHASVSSSNKKTSSTSDISGDYNAYGWGDNSRIQAQNEAAKRQDALWKEWFDKIDKLEMLIKSRNLKREPAYFYQLQTAAKDAGFSDYDISMFFGYNAQAYEEKLLNKIKQQNGTNDANRAKAEFDRSMEIVRKEKELEQKRKNEQIRIEIANFSKNWDASTNTEYGIEVREKAFNAMFEYMNPIMNSTRMEYRNNPQDYLRNAISQGESSITKMQKNRTNFYIQSKQFDLAYKQGNIGSKGLTDTEKFNSICNFVYAGLINEKKPTNVLLEKAAYAYKLNFTGIIHFAYALFLNNDLDGTADALQKHIVKYSADTVNRIEYLNKLILLNIYQNKSAEALQLYNNNSSIPISEISELEDLISLHISNTIKANIAQDEKEMYYQYPISTLMDIDLLSLVQPKNEYVQSVRQKMGILFNCQRYLSPTKELWANIEKKSTNNSTKLADSLIANGTLSRELEGAAEVIGFPLYIHDKTKYEEDFNKILNFPYENSTGGYYRIIKGYLLSEKDNKTIFYNIGNFEMPILDEKYDEVRIELKTTKLGYIPSNTAYFVNTSNEGLSFFYSSKSKAKKAHKLFVALFEKLQKQ